MDYTSWNSWNIPFSDLARRVDFRRCWVSILVYMKDGRVEGVGWVVEFSYGFDQQDLLNKGIWNFVPWAKWADITLRVVMVLVGGSKGVTDILREISL
jgi:hypothetical protein